MNEIIEDIIFNARQSTLKQFPEFAGVSTEVLWQVFSYELTQLLIKDVLKLVATQAAYNETAEQVYSTIKRTYQC